MLSNYFISMRRPLSMATIALLFDKNVSCDETLTSDLVFGIENYRSYEIEATYIENRFANVSEVADGDFMEFRNSRIGYQPESYRILDYSTVDKFHTKKKIATGDKVRFILDDNSIVYGELTQPVTTTVEDEVKLVDPFNDGSLLTKLQLNGDVKDTLGVNNGTAFNLTYTDGFFHKCALFNGVDSYVESPFTTHTDNPIYIYMYIKTSTKGQVIMGGNMAGVGRVVVMITIDGYLEFTTGSDGHISTSTCTSVDITNDAWHHIGFEYSGLNGIQSVVVNGHKYDTKTATDDNGDANFNFWLGRRQDDYFTGQIEQLEMYNRALEETELQQLRDQSEGVYETDVSHLNLPSVPKLAFLDSGLRMFIGVEDISGRLLGHNYAPTIVEASTTQVTLDVGESGDFDELYAIGDYVEIASNMVRVDDAQIVGGDYVLTFAEQDVPPNNVMLPDRTVPMISQSLTFNGVDFIEIFNNYNKRGRAMLRKVIIDQPLTDITIPMSTELWKEDI